LQGVLAQAKNGAELFWEEKSYAADGNAQECNQGALLFFFFITPNHLTFSPICLANVVLLSSGPKGMHLI